MTPASLAGHVVVVAGTGRTVATVRRLLGEGALLAVVTLDADAVEALRRDGGADERQPLTFRADPGDAATWERIAPHVEQRLGPVDAVLTDAASADVVRSVFDEDLRRRGHGGVVVVDADGSSVTDLRDLLRRTR